MKSSKLFLFLFFIGFFSLCFAGLSLFLSLNPSLLKPKVQYEVGEVFAIEGDVYRLGFASVIKKQLSPKEKIYSKERLILNENSKLSLIVSGEEISISGPTEISIEVIYPESQKVFINFSNFVDIEPKDGFKNIALTYKGWTIEPHFQKEDLKGSTVDNIVMPAISKDQEQKTAAPLDKESLLDELIAGKRSLLKKCYENYLRENPLATGKLIVEFTLQNTGRVSSSKIKDSSFFRDETFKICIQDVFKRIKTKVFDGDSIRVTYPIEFE